MVACRLLGLRLDVRILSLLGVLAALIVVGGITEPDAFLDTGNLQLILTQASVIGVVTVGMTFVIISGGIDLSVGAMVALASVWATTLATQEYGFAGIAFTAVIVGLAAGLVNGVLIAYGGMVPFIATLAMLASARGLALQITDGKTQIVTVDSVLDLGLPDSYILGIPPLVIMFAVVTVVGWLILNRTTFGRRTVAVGGNAEAARLAGIDVRRQRLYLYLLSGLCCGIAAFMLIVLMRLRPEHQRQPVRARRHRRRDHRRDPAQRRPGHHRRLRPRCPDLHHDHQHLRSQQPPERCPADRQGRHHRRRRPRPAPHHARQGNLSDRAPRHPSAPQRTPSTRTSYAPTG